MSESEVDPALIEFCDGAIDVFRELTKAVSEATEEAHCRKLLAPVDPEGYCPCGIFRGDCRYHA